MTANILKHMLNHKTRPAGLELNIHQGKPCINFVRKGPCFPCSAHTSPRPSGAFQQSRCTCCIHGGHKGTWHCHATSNAASLKHCLYKLCMNLGCQQIQAATQAQPNATAMLSQLDLWKCHLHCQTTHSMTAQNCCQSLAVPDWLVPHLELGWQFFFPLAWPKLH